MQFLPLNYTALNFDSSAMLNAANSIYSSNDNNEFDAVLASFIEDGRSDYSGRPAGFRAAEESSGTFGETEADLLKKALKKRGVAEESLDLLDSLMLGGDATVSKVFNALTGKYRATEGFVGNESDDFSQLMAKLGFNKGDIEELLDASHTGNKTLFLQKMTGKLGEMGSDSLDMSPEELEALLKGFDLSKDGKTKVAGLFGKEDTLTLNKEQLAAIVAEASAEYEKRAKAAKQVQNVMREAMAEALQGKKLAEQNALNSDPRGSLRSQQSEDLMQHTINQKAGIDKIKQEASLADHNSGQDMNFDEYGSGKSRSERILNANPDGKGKQSEVNEKAKEPLADFFRKIDVVEGAVRTTEPQPVSNNNMAQNLNNTAKSFNREIFSQVENGIMQNAANGARQLTLQLTPNHLGTLTVILSVNQGEVRATIKTDKPETAEVLREQMVELKTALEEQGLKVKELDVQTELKDNSSAEQWNGHKEHNLMQQAEERERQIRLSKMRRGQSAADENNNSLEAQTASVESTGLHIVA